MRKEAGSKRFVSDHRVKMAVDADCSSLYHFEAFDDVDEFGK